MNFKMSSNVQNGGHSFSILMCKMQWNKQNSDLPDDGMFAELGGGALSTGRIRERS